MHRTGLSDIPFFSGLSSELLLRLEKVMQYRVFPAFSTVCRKGDQGQYFYAIASGAVTISLNTQSRESTVYMGAGQVFGEMSLLADLPVSATVQTVRETGIFLFSRDTFTQLLDTEPDFHRSLVEILVNRLRHRSETLGTAFRGSCCFWVYPEWDPSVLALQAQLFELIHHYSPGSVCVEIADGTKNHQPVRPAEPLDSDSEWFPPADDSVRQYIAQDTASLCCVDASVDWINTLLEKWKVTASIDQVLFVPISMKRMMDLAPGIRPNDAVIAAGTENRIDQFRDLQKKFAYDGGFTTAILSQTKTGWQRPQTGSWGFVIDERHLHRDRNSTVSSGRRSNPVDGLARWVTRREIGLCLSSGAARGFAHLGVLEVLEDHNIPIDCISGTSMGGIVALVYSMTGSIHESIREIRRRLGSNRKVRDLAIPPRGSLYAGKKVRDTATAFFGDTWINQMKKPCAVVAADLVHGERLVINQGSAVEAALATSAIPGLFPLIEKDGRLLSDGALVSRIPLDVLGGRRCGMRIAVNVVPSPESRRQDAETTLKWLNDRCSTILGLRFIIGFSWELQAWNHGINEAEHADVLVSPDTRLYAGYNFDSFDEMVDAGRRAAEQQLQVIKGSVNNLFKPGIP